MLGQYGWLDRGILKLGAMEGSERGRYAGDGDEQDGAGHRVSHTRTKKYGLLGWKMCEFRLWSSLG